MKNSLTVPNDRSSIELMKKSQAGKLLGSIKTKKKSEASRKNGKLGGYWKHKKNTNI